MRLLRRSAMAGLTRLALLLMVGLLLGTHAEAVTVRDLIELSRAGLGDDVLIELIAVDGSVFNLDAATLRELKAAGVSEKVILAMLRAGRGQVPTPSAVAAPQAPEVHVDVPAPTVIVQQAPPVFVNVPVPYYIPVVIPDGHRQRRGFTRHVPLQPDRSLTPGRQFINTGGAPVPTGHVEAILHRPKTTCWGNVCW